ncbi:MAG TPA: polysaccharide pyruvyl transferase family protein [Prochlorococcus sp.]|nr:polysaccharide pyruvyl transferase family protein [Prochlorococcus sp.]
MKTVWLLGMHDLSNYGDALFPYIFKRHIDSTDSLLKCVSLTGQKSIFSDAWPSISLEHFQRCVQCNDIVVLLGGNMIFDIPFGFVESKKSPYPHNCIGSDFWLKGLKIAVEKQCRIIINSVGAFAPLKRNTLKRWDQLKNKIDYVSWRDLSTWRIMGSDQNQFIVPDTALHRDHSSLFHDNKVSEAEGKILLNIRPRSLFGLNLSDIASTLADLAQRWSLPIVAHANSESHTDLIACKQLSAHAPVPFELEVAPSIQQSFNSIQKAKLVITSSMHTYVTKASVGGDVILITKPRYNKFKAVTAAMHSQGFVTESWQHLHDIENHDPRTFAVLGSESTSILDLHWQKVKRIIFG